ncbi:MAG: hypothetical protein BWX79_03139 [Alphaproteobacteria bacterium ADurb.Bin100]|nr:MAG: hypothetical protein BWX79_03139 [Alphaproteobacteria bacterium ADurb.Bin100]
MAVLRGVEIRALGLVQRGAGGADPVHGLATRIDLRDHRLGRVPAAQAAHLERLDLLQRQVGNVDVQQPGPGADHLLLRQLQHDFARLGPRGVEVRPAPLDLRERDCRDAEQVALHRRAHGAGVDGVVAHVGAVVDARDHQVGPVAQQAGQRDVHTIGRRAVHVAKTVGGRLHVEWRMQCQRVRFGAVVLLRRHHFDLGHGPQRLVQRHDAGSLVAVVVGNEDFHGGSGL